MYLWIKYLIDMELTINIKEQSKIEAFLRLIKEIDYVEIVDIKEDLGELPIEHRELLDKRLHRIEGGKASFKNWELIKKKYESKAV
jgi:hypothetical protein